MDRASTSGSVQQMYLESLCSFAVSVVLHGAHRAGRRRHGRRAALDGLSGSGRAGLSSGGVFSALERRRWHELVRSHRARACCSYRSPGPRGAAGSAAQFDRPRRGDVARLRAAQAPVPWWKRARARSAGLVATDARRQGLGAAACRRLAAGGSQAETSPDSARRRRPPRAAVCYLIVIG